MAVQPAELTSRELEVIRAYIAEGSTKGAAGRLGRAESTVKATLANIRSKVGADSTVQAVWRLRHLIGD